MTAKVLKLSPREQEVIYKLRAQAKQHKLGKTPQTMVRKALLDLWSKGLGHKAIFIGVLFALFYLGIAEAIICVVVLYYYFKFLGWLLPRAFLVGVGLATLYVSGAGFGMAAGYTVGAAQDAGSFLSGLGSQAYNGVHGFATRVASDPPFGS